MSPLNGYDFETFARRALEQALRVDLQKTKIAIGSPPRDKEFDLVGADRRFVGDGKAYRWRNGFQRPEAKLVGLRDQAATLTVLLTSSTVFIALCRDCSSKTGEPLADYFVRLNRHLLGRVAIIEVDEVTGGLRTVHGKLC